LHFTGTAWMSNQKHTNGVLVLPRDQGNILQPADALITNDPHAIIGIITAEKPSLRLSPFPEATATDSPGTGRRVIITGSRPGWYYLTIEGSTATGWMPASEVAPLIPEKS
jgi:hypothetical protein